MPSTPPPEDAEEGPVLGPEDLDIERRENVVPIDEGRYVIASDADAAKRAESIAAEAAASRDADPVPGSANGAGAGRGTGDRSDPADLNGVGAAEPRSGTATAESRPEAVTAERVRRWHERSLRAVDSHYGFRLSVKTGDRVAHRQLFSDDVATLFDGLLTWYAGRLDGETPVEDVLGILLSESNVRVRFPPRTIREMLATHDLSLDDSIGELFGAIADGEGVVFPPDDTGEFLFPSDDSD